MTSVAIAAGAAGLSLVVDRLDDLRDLSGTEVPVRGAVPFLILALVHLADEPRAIVQLSVWTRQLMTWAVLVEGLLQASHLPGPSTWARLDQLPWSAPYPTVACTVTLLLLASSRLLGTVQKRAQISTLLTVLALPPAMTSLMGRVFDTQLEGGFLPPVYLRTPMAFAALGIAIARLCSPLVQMPGRWLLEETPTTVWFRRMLWMSLVVVPGLMLVHDRALDSVFSHHVAAVVSTMLLLSLAIAAIATSGSKLRRTEALLEGARQELEQRVADRTHELTLANEALQRDIAERRGIDEQLKASRERLRSVTESAIDPILTVDSQGKVLHVNPAAVSLFGYPAPSLVGTPLSTLIPALAAAEAGFSEAVAGWLGKTRRCTAVPASGARVELEVSMGTWEERGGRRYAMIGRDITARLQTEADLHDAKNVAEAASQAKSAFLANMSHELRTPMNVILGMTELLGNTGVTADQLRYVRSARAAGDHLLLIINDILDISKIEAGAIQLESVDFDLRELCEQCTDFLAPQANAKRLDLVCKLAPALPARVMGDPQRLRQVLVNLLGNAVKFTDKGSVLLNVSAPASDRLHLTVTDTGTGIAPEHQELIFQAFTQADDSATRRHGGTGLGLSISRRLVDLMDGRLWVDSTPGRGSSFHVEIRAPFCSSPAPFPWPETMDPELPAMLRQLRVVVAGGKGLQRDDLCERLAHLGVHVTEVVDGAGLPELLRSAEAAKRSVELAILDSDSPMDAEPVTWVRVVQEAGLQRPPKVVVVLRGDQSEDSLRLRGEVHAVLRKPVRTQALLDALATALGRMTPRHHPSSQDLAVLAETPRRILVVDDAVDNVRLMEAFLRDTQWRVDTAADGVQAMGAWTQAQGEGQPYDAVLMDVQMPHMDGLAATRAIRKQETELGLSPCPIVAVTAHAPGEARQTALGAGCTAFLTKPVRRSRLLDVLIDVLAEGSQQAAVEGLLVVEVDPLLTPLIPGFLRHRAEDIDTIRLALTTGDFDRITLIGHSMKGSGASYGFERVSELGRDLEQAAKERDVDRLTTAVDHLARYIGRVQVAEVQMERENVH